MSEDEKKAAPVSQPTPLEPRVDAEGGSHPRGVAEESHGQGGEGNARRRGYSLTRSLKELKRDVEGESLRPSVLEELKRTPRPRFRSECAPCPTCQEHRASSSADQDIGVLPCGHRVNEAVNHCRPCIRVSCRHNLYLDPSEAGSLKVNFPDVDPSEMKQSCSLDMADEGGMTLEAVGAAVNLTRERVRQMEEQALRKVRRAQDFTETWKGHVS